MDFICAQPDTPLFIWQLQTLLTSFLDLGVNRQNIHFLVLLENGNPPSPEIRSLEKYASIYYYRERTEGRFYPPSSKPYLFAKHWERFPEIKDRHYLFVESDMLIYAIPDLPKNEIWYWSDAENYLETGRFEILLDKPVVSGRSFGFHCYGKGATPEFWYQVEKDSQELYFKMATGNTDANIWICEMRAWMWNAWQHFNNIIHPQLLFNDGHGLRKNGATLYHQLSSRAFKKRKYQRLDDIEEIKIDPAFSLHDYLKAIKRAKEFFLH